MKVSIIIPVYNEEKTLEEVLTNVLNLKFSSSIDSFELIVVDDASTDSSFEEINRIIQKNGSDLIQLSHSHNKGKGAALRTGIAISSGDIIVFHDSDLELSPNDIPKSVDCMLKHNVEFVNGSRYIPGIIRPTYAYKRYVLNKLFSNLVSLLLDVRITDIACGHKIFSRELIEQLDLKEDRFGVEAEIVIKVLRLRKNAIIEVPVEYFPRNYGEGKKFKNIDGLKVLWAIFKYGLFKF